MFPHFRFQIFPNLEQEKKHLDLRATHAMHLTHATTKQMQQTNKNAVASQR